MAHGWDSYFRNLPPPSSDASTLRVPLDAEGNLPPRIDNLSGHHGFPSMVSSHEGPATNFGTNFYADSGLSSPGAVYPNYYGNAPWHANHHQQAVKDYNIPNFAPEEFPPAHHFATPDHSAFAAELKQEYGLLNSPFLEDYSDVSNSAEADLNDTRPSCKFTHSNSAKAAYHHVDVAKHHDTPLWPSMSTDHIPSPFSKTSGTPFAVQSRCLSKTETKQKLPGFVPDRKVTTEIAQCLSPSKTETKQRLSDSEQHRPRTADNVQSPSLSKTVTKQVSDCDQNRRETTENVQRLSPSKTETKRTLSNHVPDRMETTENVRLSPSKTETKRTLSNHVPDRMETTENVQRLSPSKTETKQPLSNHKQDRIETTKNVQRLSPSKTATKRAHSDCEQDRTETAKTARTSIGNDQLPNHCRRAMAMLTTLQDGIEHITERQSNDQKIGDADDKGVAIVTEKPIDGHLAVHQNSDVMEDLDGEPMSSESEMEDDSDDHQTSPEGIAEEEPSRHHKSSDDLMEEEPKGKEEEQLCCQQKKSQETTVVASNGIPDDVGDGEDNLVDTGEGNDNDIVQSISEPSDSQDAADKLKGDSTPNSHIPSLESSNQGDESSSQNNVLGHLLGDKDCNSADDGVTPKECNIKYVQPCLDPNDSITEPKHCLENDTTCATDKGEISSFVDKTTQPSQVASGQEKPAQQNQKTMDKDRSKQQSQVAMNQVDPTPRSIDKVDKVDPTTQSKEPMDQVDPTTQNQDSTDQVDPTPQNQESRGQEESMHQQSQEPMGQVDTTPQNQESMDKVDPTPPSKEPMDKVDPTLQSQEPMGQVDTTPQNQESMDKVDPTPPSKLPMDKVDPTPPSKLPMDKVDPTPHTQESMGQVDQTPQSQESMDQVDPTPQTQESMDQEESTHQQSQYQVDPTPQSQESMAQVDPTPQAQEPMGQVDPTPQSQESMGQLDPTPQSQESMDQVDPTPQTQESMGQLDPTPQAQESMGQEESTHQQSQEPIVQVDPTAQNKVPMDQEEPTQQQSQVAMELQSFEDNVPTGEPLQEADGTSEPEQSELDLWYGEPLSSGDDDDDDDPESGQMEASQTTTEPATPLLRTSVQMRKRLQPVVVLKLLEPRDSVKQTYQCADCELTTESTDSLIEHHHRRHFNKTFHFCQTCDTYFNGQAQKHTCFASDEASELLYDPPARTKHKTTRSCRVCHKTFDKKYKYIQHMRSHTGKTPYKCGACGLYFSQTVTLRRHKTIPGRCQGPNAKRRVNPKESSMKSKNIAAKSKRTGQDSVSSSVHIRECYVKLVDIRTSKTCSYCSRQFPTLRQRQKHEYNVHRSKNRNKSYFQNYYLSKKQKTGGTSSFAETNKNLLEDEAENRENAGKFKCPFCPRTFNWSYNRARHLRDCVRDLTFGTKLKAGNKFRCPLCRATFSQSQNRKRHIETFCLKDFVLQLAKNVRVGHNSQPSSRMAKKTVNTRHRTEHKSEQTSTSLDGKPHYQCLHCPAVFAHASGKYRHMKKHEIYKMTGKLFRFRHTAYSYDYKPRKGNGKKTEQAEDSPPPSDPLRAHRYRCSLCPATFINPSGKYKHMQKHRLTGQLNIEYRNSATSQTKSKSVNTRVREETSSVDATEGSPAFTCRFCGKCFDDPSSFKKHEASKKHKGERPYLCLECGKRFKKPTHLSSHKTTHQRRIQCTTCKKILPSIGELIEHRRSHIKKGLLQCPDCSMQFQYPVYLRRHMESRHKASQKHVQKEQKQVQCSICNEVFPEAHSLQSHYLIDHNEDESFPCGGCRKTFYTKRELHLHRGKWSGVSKCPGMKARSCGDEVKCSYCPRIFTRESHRKNHHRAHKNNVLKSCPKCASFFGYTKITHHIKNCRGELEELTADLSSSDDDGGGSPLRRQHLTSHAGGQHHACMHCGRKFTDHAMCFQHEAFCDGVYREGQSVAKTRPRTELWRAPGVKELADGQFKCKFCTKTFVKSRNLRHHILTHTEVNPYRCKTCGSCFSRHDHMTVHESRCKGVRLRLQVCVPKISLDDVGQGWKKKLERSKMDEEEDDRFECGVCFKVLSSESNLARHFSMIHDSAKSFACKRCGVTYTTEKSLKRHRSMVKCQRPRGNATKPPQGATSRLFQRIRKYPERKRTYACKYCPRSFTTSGQRVQHTRLHTGEKPYGCDRCGERFIRKDYLVRHSLKCNMSDMYSVLCDRCGGVFTEDALEAHHKHCRTDPSLARRSQKPTPQSPPKGFSCAYCGSRFLLFSQLQQHFLTTHRQDTSKEPPTATAPLQQQLSNMVRIKEEPLDMEYGTGLIGDGNPLFDPDAGLDDELEKPLACSQCDMRFAHAGALKGHLRAHAKAFLFRCKTCNKGYWNKALLRRHSSKCTRLKNKNASVTADMDLALAPVLVFNQCSQTTGTGVLRTNFKCKDEPVSEDSEQSASSSTKRKSARYQCSECDKSFTDGLLLISHLEDHGREEQEKKERRCVKCGRTFTSPGALGRHMANMHGETKRYGCPDCRKLFYSQTDLDIHRTCHDPNRPFNCKLCGQRFWNTRALSNHCSESHPESVHKCRVCDKSFSLKKSLARHYKMRHPDLPRGEPPLPAAARESRSATAKASSIEVSIAGESDTDDENDDVDADGDSDGDTDDSDTAPYFPCHVCSKTFPTFESLEDHQRYHLGEKPHLCAECGKCFFHATQLLQHQRMHKSEFQCQTCGRGFVSLFALRKHKHSHGKSRPYRCTKCSLFFPGAVQMAEHMAAAHKEENFPCDICNRSFRSKSSRAEHRKSHKELISNTPPPPENANPLRASTSECPPPNAGQEKLSCGICFETFDGPDKVLEHGCKPSRDRPYSCPDCDKHFVFASHLRKHNAIHQQSQPYALECNRCRMNFSYRASFVTHIKKHAEEEATKGRASGTDEDEHFYKCPLCPRQFSTPTKLVDHFSAHSENTHECKTCKLTYPSKSELEEHERSHMTAATQFECTECGNSYLGSDAFRQHRCSHRRKATTDPAGRSNPPTRESAARAQTSGDESDVDVTGDDSYDCPLCRKQFTSKSSLLEHHNSQHGAERPFKCQYCGKGFSLKKYLREHERRERLKMAPEEKTPVFKCHQCGLRLAAAKDLTAHMRKHAEKGAGDHRCFMCYKSFKQLSLLRQHEESHVGQVVYECTECDKAFAFPHLLEEHQRSHAGPSSSSA